MHNHYDKTSKRYDDRWRQYNEQTIENLEKVLDQQEVKFQSVTDYGCGTGEVLYQLLSSNSKLKVYGVDPSEQMREKAREKLQGFQSVEILSLEQIKSLPKVDLVLTTNALHHFKQPVEVLTTLIGLAKSNGSIYVSDYSKQSITPKYFEWLIKILDSSHVRAYTLDEAVTMVKKISNTEIILAQETNLGRWWQGYELLIKKV
jgi:ubiquinone/menaquinone biosynthesis C-methylase UbiE